VHSSKEPFAEQVLSQHVPDGEAAGHAFCPFAVVIRLRGLPGKLIQRVNQLIFQPNAQPLSHGFYLLGELLL
jgi:hypothetical protein